MDYKSKKVAIISVLSTLLVVGAIAGTVAFVKGNNQSGAAENVIANETTNIVVENVIDGDTNTNTNTNTNSVVPSNNGNAGGDGGNIAPVAPDNTPTTDENGNQVIVDVDGNSHVIGPVTNDDGSTTTTEGDGIGGYIQRTVIPEHMIWEWTIVDWTEILPKTIGSDIEFPSVEGEKYYTVDGSDTDTAAVVGQNVTYYIDVTNSGETALEQFRVVDSVPEGTELVKGTISDEGNLDEYGRVIWKLDLNPQETKTVSFKVTVISSEANPIVNKAKVNGEETNEVKTPVIETSKKAFVVEEDETLSTRDAKVGETIRYVISLTNNSEEEGTTTVFDTVPENTEFVSADERFTVSEDKSSLEATISVPAGETIELTFDVTVVDDEEDEATTTSVRNIAVIGGIPTPPVETKVANIKTVKDYSPKDVTLHELDTIHYELVSTNSGDGEGTVVITDTVPAGTELVPNSISEGGNMGEDGVITWNVTVSPGGEQIVSFDVLILPFKDPTITITNAEAKQDGKDIPPTDTEVEKEYKKVVVSKEFVDVTDNVDGTRPTTITVELSNNATDETKTQELNADNSWTYTFEKLDKYHTDKTEIEYDVKEIDVNSYYADTYETSKDGDNYSIKVINTLKYEEIKTEKVATKEWVDNDNTSGNRPTSVILDLYADGEFLKSSDPIEGNKTTNEGWTYTFTELQKYHEDGTEIEYTIEENDNSKDPHYTVNEEGLTVTNTIDYDTFKTTVSATKNWVDNSNKTNHRPTSIHLNVLNDKDEVVLENQEVTGTGDTWTYTSEEVPMYYDDGTTIVYSVKEVEEDQTPYETEYSDDTLTITNTIDYNNYKTTVSATKVWVDNNNNSGNRPTSIHLNVLNDKDEVVLENEEVTGNATDGSWTYTSEEVPMYYDDGTTIVYSVVEVEANTGNYNTTYSQDKLTVTNTIDYDNYTVDVPVKKTWDDDNDREEVRPDSVSFDLYVRKEAGDEKVSSHLVEKDSWTYTFTGLAKYDAQGNELSYYVVEAEANIPKHYTMERVSETEIKNKIDYTSFTIDKPVTKVWVDEPNTTHSDITFELWGNNDDTKPAGTHTLKDGETTYTFTGLQKYNADGSTITYRVQEVEEGQNNYTTTYDQDTLTVTNTIVDPTTEITITKIWVDPDEEGKVHKDIDVRILQNGNTYKVVTIPGKVDDTYTYTETGLPKYKKDASGYILDANGNVQNNEYTVEEITTGWTDYTPSYSKDTLTITNTIVEDNKASLPVTKIWVDDKTEHQTIKIWLTKRNSDGTYSRTDKFVELPSGTTKYTFTDLQKYDENGQYIKYGVEEETVTGYTTTYNGNEIKNTIEAGETSVTVEKTWIRPDENYEDVTIRLYQGDKEYDHVTFKKDNYTNGKATYTFSPLPEYNTTTGQKYVYTTREDTVQGYSTNVVGTNKYQNVIEPGSKDVTVTKTWDAPAGDIPNITIILRDGTTEVGRYELVYPETSHTFEGLPKYNTTTGQEITYTVDEISIDGYDTTIKGTNITNKVVEPNDVSITITKNWIDPSDMTHPDVRFILKQNGVQYPDANTYYTMPGEGTTDTTTLPITGLPRYKKNGDEYVKDANGRVVENVYTVEEVVPTGYELIEQSTDTFTVTNRILQDYTKAVNVTKEWSIPEGVEVEKPTITVNLLRDGTEVDEKQIVPPSTTCEFPNLPVYDLDSNSSRYGERYVYTVTEDEVRNFVSTVNGYTITNTFRQAIQGTVTYKQTTHGEADVKVPMDVVFILDTSGSMDKKGSNESRGNKMVSAVNQTIKYIMDDNIENRVAVVTFSGFNNNKTGRDHKYDEYLDDPDAKVLMPLGTYKAKSGNTYLKITENSGGENDVITTQVNKGTVATYPSGTKYIKIDDEQPENQSDTLIGATYTQMGIAEGANQLINAENKEYSTVVNGVTYNAIRTPVIILLSDGGPTVYTATTDVTASSTEAGDENNTTENEVYWTVKTAKAFKDKVTEAYYTDNNVTGSAKFFTIGYGISNDTGENQAEKVVLNPTKTNIELLEDYGGYYDYWGYYHDYSNRYKEIYDKFHNEDSSLNSFSYSDAYKGTTFNTQELRDFMTQSLSADNTVQITRPITLAESDDMKVYMPEIDTSKEFSVKVNGTTVTTSISNEQYVGQDEERYYVDLSSIPQGSTVDIFYTKVTKTAGE